MEFIKNHGDFNIIGACYPEGHQESGGLVRDMKHLKDKVDAGVSQLITQLFFDNEYFTDLGNGWIWLESMFRWRPESCRWSTKSRLSEWYPCAA